MEKRRLNGKRWLQLQASLNLKMKKVMMMKKRRRMNKLVLCVWGVSSGANVAFFPARSGRFRDNIAGT